MKVRWGVALATLAAAVVAVPLGFLGLPAGAQANCPPPDPYSGNQQCPRNITLSLSIDAGPVGARIRIRAHGFRAGDQVTGTFNGVVQFTVAAQPGVGQTAMPAKEPLATAGLAALRNLLGQTDNSVGGIDQVMTVPDVALGSYPVCVSGSGAQACATFRVTAAETVLGTSVSRGPASGGSGGTEVLGQSFARTGIAVLTLLILAVSLIVVGRFLRAASRRRRGVQV